jgi:methylglyoxal synthase
MHEIQYRPHSGECSSLLTRVCRVFSLPLVIAARALGRGSARILIFSQPSRREETVVVFEVEVVDLGLCGVLMILINVWRWTTRTRICV